MALESQTKITFCRICEATCGLEVEVEGNRVVAIRPDPKHVVSEGFVCVKGTRYPSIQNSPDRILHPQKRIGTEWHEIGWDQAISEIGRKLRELSHRHGPDSVGHFVGSAGGANVLSPIFRSALMRGLGSRRMYGTGTCDTMNKFRVNEDMYGSPMRLAYPDTEHTEFLMILGANPAISGTTLYHLPRAKERLAQIGRKGGRVVYLNPRRIETAQPGEHIFIRPDTDVYFLAAFANELIRCGGVARDRVERTMKGLDAFAETVAPWTPERQAQVTGIPAEVLCELVRAHGRASGAALYMATGVNQGRSGTLCFWLLESINAISGNLDRRGGTLMGEGLMDMAREINKDPQMMVHYARKDGLPTVSGLQPSGMLADDILGDESDRVTALIVEASNPILACGNPDGRLTRALEKLELLVSIDLFRNEVGSLAHYVLPVPSWLERPEIPYALQSFAGCTPKPYMIYADPVVDAPPDVRPEWWIYIRLADAAGVTLFENRLASVAAKLYARLLYGPLGRFLPNVKKIFDGMLEKAGLPGTSEMAKNHPHGLLLPENEGENFLGTDRVLTPDARINLAPPSYVEAFAARVEDLYREELATRDRIKLIGKREMRRMNSCSSNSEALVREKTNYAYLSPGDAARIGVDNDDLVEVVSRFGKIEIPVRVTSEMMDRTVAIPQCWGHQSADGLSHARKHPGINSNLLAGDGPETIETLSGMSHLSGILVDIRSVQTAPSRER